MLGAGPRGEQIGQLRVQPDVPVVAELAQRGTAASTRTDEDNRVRVTQFLMAPSRSTL
jgi:hypothetical protein